mgnify:CR=1 FL=1|jgi:hypothetical protein
MRNLHSNNGVELISLNDIFDQYGSDKGSLKHNYGSVYEIYLHEFRNKSPNLLELGVLNGASLRAWRTYIPNASIWGLDIDPVVRERLLGEINIEVITGSQSDDHVLGELVAAASPGFDIVIDDGSHVNAHIIASFSFLFPRLLPGGVYIIEDLLESYHADEEEMMSWAGMHLNSDLVANDRGALNKMFLEIIFDMDHIRGQVESIHFHTELAIICKKG